MPMLEVNNIHTYYGNIHALQDVSVFVDKGEIVTIIGANGAGKSTLLKTISGLVRARRGAIKLADQDITHLKPHEIVMRKMVQVPEGRRIFGQLTVSENLDMGAFTCRDAQLKKNNLDHIFALFPRLHERRKQVAGTLSGGEQQMLAMGRAMMTNPDVLLMDEPSMGLAPVLVDSIFDTVVRLNEAGATILLVEQNAAMALQVASRGYVLQTGTIILADTADNLAKNETVRQAYLGE
jgi:branched-chain amino acid transport system ATP-binding protein